MKREHEHVFAVIRVDGFQGPDCPVHDKVTVKEIIWDADAADREVKRLNGLPNKPKETYYYSQITRLIPKPAPALESGDLVVKGKQGPVYTVTALEPTNNMTQPVPLAIPNPARD